MSPGSIAGFESLSEGQNHQPAVWVSGLRAEDMAVRLKYAGISEDRLVLEPDLRQAVAQAVAGTGADQTLYLLPTYTALLALRGII